MPQRMLDMVMEHARVTQRGLTIPARDRQITLDREECLGRLTPGGVGRVAVSVGALPAIFPVNFAMLEGDIVFRVDTGTKLETAIDGAVVAFEIDYSDATSDAGWSVLVIGQARLITNPGTLARAADLPVAPWGGGGGGGSETFAQLPPSLISGRQLADTRIPGPEEGR